MIINSYGYILSGFITFSNFRCKIASVTVQAKITVGVCRPLQDCSVSVWAEYVPVIFLVSVCLQIWGRLVITFWVKIDRDVGEFFNLKLLFYNFWKRDYFYDIFLH